MEDVHDFAFCNVFHRRILSIPRPLGPPPSNAPSHRQKRLGHTGVFQSTYSVRILNVHVTRAIAYTQHIYSDSIYKV